MNRADALAVWCDILNAEDLQNVDETREVVTAIVSHFLQSNHCGTNELRRHFAAFLQCPLSAETEVNVPSPQPFRKLEFTLTERDMRQSIRDAYVAENAADLLSVIQHFRGVITVDFFDTAPARVRTDIVRFFSSSKLEPFPFDRSLAYLRGPWRHLALLQIATNPLLFIQTLSDGRRLHKSDLLDFASSIGIVPYPKAVLVDFATRIFYQAESEARIRNALRLVNVALKAAGEVSETLANALVASFARRKAKTSVVEVSLVLRTMADFLRTPKPLDRYLAGMLDDWRGYPLLYGNFHVVHLRFFSRVADEAIPGYYAMDEERHIATVLEGERPSLVLSALREAQMAAVSMNDPRSIRIMQNLSEKVLSRITSFQLVNWAFTSRMQLISRWLIQPVYQSFHHSICEKLMFTLETSSSLAFFPDYLSWIPAALRSGALSVQSLGELNLLTQVRAPVIFNLALAILREQLTSRLSRKETLAIESSLTFLTAHASGRSYYSIVYLRKLVGLLAEVHRDAMFHFCVSAVRMLPFFPAFFAVCEVIKRAKDQEFATFLVSAVIELVHCDTHRRALEMIRTQRLNREILELAQSDDRSD
jgi:hypothetical protein